MPIRLATAALAFAFAAASAYPQPPADHPIDARQRARVIEGAITSIEAHYFSEADAKRITDYIRAQLRHGEYDGLDDVHAFAKTVTRDLRGVTQDYHLRLGYSEEVVTGDDVHDRPGNPAEMMAFAHLLSTRNHGFSAVRLLEGNIGYIDLRLFADAAVAGGKLAAAMKLVADSDALIIDLRHNHGGEGNMVGLFMAYFLEREVHLGDLLMREGREQSWTPAFVAGERYLKKPVYILISDETFSAGEGFAYAMQVRGLAAIVGQATHGGTNPEDEYRIDEHFFVDVSYGSPVDAVTGTNWKGGVKPDVAIAAADDALAVAQRLVLEHLLEDSPAELTAVRRSALETLTRQLKPVSPSPPP